LVCVPALTGVAATGWTVAAVAPAATADWFIADWPAEAC
jgi:hypothetical protein